MRAYRLEKRIDGIILWLERMKNSYRTGHVESAYMDAECARTDLENLRSDVFGAVSRKRKPRFFFPVMKAAFIALVMVMMTVRPLSRETVPPLEPEIPAPAPAAETVRETPAPRPKTQRVAAKTRKPRKPSQSQKAEAPKPAPKPAPSKAVAYDKVLSLVQTGQRAMKDDKSVIKVK
ncbi:MAG: hypothetical protein IJP86_03040 [Synergistaceae bacterium]|nr:hypothetical protein [Synergistaceae bacterium]